MTMISHKAATSFVIALMYTKGTIDAHNLSSHFENGRKEATKEET